MNSIEIMNSQRTVRNGTPLLEFKRNCTTLEFPNRFSRYLMEKGQIYFWPAGNFHVVTDADLAKQVLKSPDFSADRSAFFISRMPNLDLRLITDFFSVVQKMMVMSDGQEHALRRKAAFMGLEDDVLERFKAKIEETVNSLLAQAFQKSKLEFMAEVAQKLPSTVLADLFRISEDDREEFLHWSNNMTAFFGGASQYLNEDGKRVNASAIALREYMRRVIGERRNNPGHDYLSYLIQGEQKYGLTEDEIISQAIMMLVAGQVTTTDQIGNILFQIAHHTEIQLELKRHPNLIPNAIEEMKRYDPAVTFLFRVAKKSMNLGGQPIAQGETVFISNHAVNRAPSISEPFKLDIHRVQPTHFAYGYGAHYCLGSKLGRMQINLLFQSLLQRYPYFVLDQDRGAERDHYSLAFSGFKQIHLEVLR